VVTVHPPTQARFVSMEHAEGELLHLGDALGVDCTVVRLVNGWVRPYETDGARNEDWYGWREPLLAPLDSIIESVRINDVTNTPGVMGESPASMIVFKAQGDVRVVYAHIQDEEVAEGDTVEAGQPVACIGNNGMCRNPHVHVGASRGSTPLQIRFDLTALGRMRDLDGE